MTGDLRFDPADVAIDPGQQVTWVNESGVPHTASAYREEIPSSRSAGVQTGETRFR
ncbi:cupredoxin domain-containing protein [Halorubrum ezzemoulense]